MDRRDSTFILNKVINIEIMQLVTKNELNYREKKRLEQLMKEGAITDYSAKA